MTTRSVDSIEPADCYVKANHLAAQIELIRKEMGRPSEKRPPIKVTNASPRECWFQALAVFRKTDRLCHEVASDPTVAVPHAPPINTIKPGHVLALLDAAGRELDEVAKALSISEQPAATARDAAKTPSDVFNTLANLDRQLNLLLERAFTPADVFQTVSFAVAYAARLTSAAPPAEAPFARGKVPGDCYQRLLGCLELSRALIKKAGHPVIEVASDVERESVLPSDCYDLASLVLGQVAFLHALKPDTNPPYPFEGNVPGRKLPSHVWQLVGVLEKQLEQLGK